MIRDQALFVSGLLVEKLGGPSVRPYQPEGLYKDMLFSNMTNYAQDKSEGLWRRSLYTYWKRTVMPPAMQVFDASSREYCTVRETRTNTPLQALNLMNDTTYVEAARLMAPADDDRRRNEARRAARSGVASGGWTPAGRRAKHAFCGTTADATGVFPGPSAGSDASCWQWVKSPRTQKLNAEELAAYSVVASLILNLDEVITKQ